jgi:hypothetical protein
VWLCDGGIGRLGGQDGWMDGRGEDRRERVSSYDCLLQPCERRRYTGNGDDDDDGMYVCM